MISIERTFARRRAILLASSGQQPKTTGEFICLADA